MDTSNANPAFLPEQIGELIVRPVQATSIALQVSTVVDTDNTNHQFRVPIVATDPTAGWTAEGDEIDPADGTLAEAVTSYYKLAGLSIITSELADDSSPAAAEIIGNGLARDIARKLDAAYFGDSVTNGPSGLESLEGVNSVLVSAWANVDAFTEAVFAAETVGATLSAFVANPTDALILATLKESTGSNRDLLQPDVTQPGVRRIAGVPMLVSSAVTEGTVWGIPQAVSMVAVRNDTRLEIDRSAYFSSDRVGIRALMRVGFVFPHEAAIQKIALD
jgi:HK97 family phage major capsid protein